MTETYPAGADVQTPFDVAILVPTVLRPQLTRCLRSLFAQDFAGRIQIMVGIDKPLGERGIVEALAGELPANMVLTVLDLGYSTSVRHGGLYPNVLGGALRVIMTYAANSRLIAYVDDDNWVAPTHLATLRAAIEGVDWAYSRRCFTEPGYDAPICVDDWESVGPDAGVFADTLGGFVDTSSLMFDKMRCRDVASLWAFPAFPDGCGDDRLVFENLRHRPGRGTGIATCYYELTFHDEMHPLRRRMFRRLGATLPSQREAGMATLDALIADFRPEPPNDLPLGTAAPAPVLSEIVKRFCPADIVSLRSDGTAAIGLVLASRAEGVECLALVAAKDAEGLSARIEALGMRGRVVAMPARCGPAAAWLQRNRAILDLVHLGETPETEVDSVCDEAWALLQRGGVLFGAPLRAEPARKPEIVSRMAERHGAQALCLPTNGQAYWVLRKP